MGKVGKDRADKVGDFLFRYMQARHRFKDRLERPLPAHELATLIERGKQEFDEIYIEPNATPPVVLDGKADDVFEAIIKIEIPRDTVLGRRACGRVAELCAERWSHAPEAGASPRARGPHRPAYLKRSRRLTTRRGFADT